MLSESEQQAATLLKKQQFTADEHISISAAIDSICARLRVSRHYATQILNACAFPQ